MDITVDQMYAIENKGHQMGFLKTFMMENAGAAATRRLITHVGDVSGTSVLVIAGLGNNGGDGMVMARHLAGYGAKLTVALLGVPENIKTDECKWNWSLLQKMPASISTYHGNEFTPPRDMNPKIIIDAIFGTGITGDIKEPHMSAIKYINSCTNAFKFGVDVPSGLDPQTGMTANIHTTCDMTVTFHRMKQGIPKRPDLTGIIHAEKIGIPPEAEEGIV